MKTVIVTVFDMFKTLGRDMEDTSKTQIKLLEIKKYHV